LQYASEKLRVKQFIAGAEYDEIECPVGDKRRATGDAAQLIPSDCVLFEAGASRYLRELAAISILAKMRYISSVVPRRSDGPSAGTMPKDR